MSIQETLQTVGYVLNADITKGNNNILDFNVEIGTDADADVGIYFTITDAADDVVACCFEFSSISSAIDAARLALVAELTRHVPLT